MGCTKTIVGSLIGGPVGFMAGSQMDAADAQSKAIKDASSATAQGTANSIEESRRQYNQTRDDFAPFRNLAPQSLATLESSMYGGPRSYTDAQGVSQTANGKQFDLANFKPEGTAAFDWQKSRTLEDLGNYFNLTGRGRGSTVQSNATGRALGDLNAAEYDKGYNRLFQQKQDYTNDLLNFAKIAQGAAGSTAASGDSISKDITSAIRYGSDNQANASLAQGQNKANLYSGLSQMPMQLGSLALMV